MKEHEKWPLYSYSMDLLNDEEAALYGKPRWYHGEDVEGETWITKAVKQLLRTYYK